MMIFLDYRPSDSLDTTAVSDTNTTIDSVQLPTVAARIRTARLRQPVPRDSHTLDSTDANLGRSDTPASLSQFDRVLDPADTEISFRPVSPTDSVASSHDSLDSGLAISKLC